MNKLIKIVREILYFNEEYPFSVQQNREKLVSKDTKQYNQTTKAHSFNNRAN